MDSTRKGYGFLDLTDINEEERSSLTSALFAEPSPAAPPSSGSWSSADKTDGQTAAWTEPAYALNNGGVNVTPLYVVHPHIVDSSCSGTPGPPTASSSLDSLPTEREMAPHSPQRNAAPAGHAASAPPPPSGLPPAQLAAYSQPPPPIYNAHPNPAPNHHWPHHQHHLMPPASVYVSQVTANVNVHGYMGQYYHSQYVPTQPEARVRDGGRDRTKGGGRRGGGAKRPQSPPQQTPPYVFYQQYYPTPQAAQGAPLYHMPVYQHPMSYVGYPYMPYVDYGMMEDPNNPEQKGPDEYPPEMMMEQEHVPHEIYYPHSACLPPGPVYDPGRPMEGPCSIEPYPHYYQVPQQPVHQFNVHAKNFVRQSDSKNFNPPPPQEMKVQDGGIVNKPNHITGNAVDALPMKDMKIQGKQPANKHEKASMQSSQATPKNSEKASKPPASDAPKTAWGVNNKNTEVTKNTTSTPTTTTAAVVSQPAPAQAPVQVSNKTAAAAAASNAVPPKIKTTSPAPFVQKPFVKSGPTTQMSAVILPQQGLPSKAPFSNKHKKDVQQKSQEVPEPAEVAVPPSAPMVAPAAEPKQAPVAAKTVVPVAIPIHNQSTASITTKAPFGHRKSSLSSPETPQVTPAPQAPTPSDFPPPPAPRRSGEPAIVVPTVAQPPPSGRTWASLFVNPAAATTTTDDSATVSTTTATASTNQRPVAKVGPFDASPLQNDGSSDKSGMTAAAKLTNAINKSGNKDDSGMPGHIHDPNAYRLGEFLSKYQLNYSSVSLQPRGLSNRSNYCYINAILQALIACPPFYNMLKSLPYHLKKGKSNTPMIDAMVELCSEFSPLPPNARITRTERASRTSPAGNNGSDNADSNSASTAPPVNVGASFEPTVVLHMLRDMNNGDSFRVEGRQEDAEEFLGCLLNGINDEMLELIKLIDPEDNKDAPTVNGNDQAAESDDDDEWKVMGPKNKGSIERRCLASRTPLSDIFRGQLRSRLQRATDTTTSDTTHCVQPFFTLPLDIERSNSVREALERVAGKDRLEGVTCPSRGRPVEAWQQVLLEQLPAVLLLHLKCFLSRPTDGATIKIVKTIEYPVELKIDPKIISPKMKYGTKQRSYKLFAVVYHEGAEAEKGHYLTDVYHVGCGGWLRYDDSIVTAVTEQQVLHPRSPRMPYLLLYRRQDTMQPVRHPQTS